MTYQLTAIDIAAMRKCDRLVVALNRHNPSYRQTGVRLIKEARKTERNPFPQELEHAVDCPVSVTGCYGAPADSVIAFALVSVYRNQRDHESSVLGTLRAGDQIEFRFYADCHTNGYLAAAGLHGDALYLDVTRGEGKTAKRYTYELVSSASPNNDARMVRGLPETDEYRRDGARCREHWVPAL